MSVQGNHTNIEIWLGGLYKFGEYLGGLSGYTFETKAQAINNNFLIDIDTHAQLTSSGITQIQFNCLDVAYRIPVDFLLDASENNNGLLVCNKAYMSNAIKLKEEEYDNVEESRWIK